MSLHPTLPVILPIKIHDSKNQWCHDYRWTGGQVDRWAGGQVVRWSGGRWSGGQVGRWAGGQVDRWAGGQVGSPAQVIHSHKLQEGAVDEALGEMRGGHVIRRER